MNPLTSLKYFRREEFVCPVAGEAHMNEQLLQALGEIREALDEPMVIMSGYLSDQHPITQAKIDRGAKHGGPHALGYAVDVSCAGPQAIRIIELAIQNLAVTGIGVKQNGAWNSRFVHIDAVPTDNNLGLPRPAIWSY